MILILKEEQEALRDLENIINNSIPKVDKIRWDEEIEQGKSLTTLQIGYVEKNDHVIQLGLSDCKITNLPDSIGDLEYLETLDLVHNYITEIPPSISNLKRLTYLYLYKNKIRMLPESIGDLENLRILNIDVNDLRTIPESIGNLSCLEDLELYFNSIEFLPDCFNGLKKLRIVNMDNNLIKKLPLSLTKLDNLQVLRVSGNQLEELPESIGDLKGLKKLILTQNKLKILPDSIGNLNYLEFLNVSYNILEKLPLSIQHLTQLKNIELIKNNFARREPSLKYLPIAPQMCLDEDVFKHEPRFFKDLMKSELGIIEIDSGEIIVRDPHENIVKDHEYRTKKGNWYVYATVPNEQDQMMYDTYITSVLIVHEEYLDLRLTPEDWDAYSIKIHSDQIGIYDASVVPEKTPFKGTLEKAQETEEFISETNRIVNTKEYGFYKNNGIIIKDMRRAGKYPIFTYSNNRGFVIAVWIDFLEGEVFESFNLKCNPRITQSF